MAKVTTEQAILNQWIADDLVHGALVEVGAVYVFTNPNQYPTTLIEALAASAAKVAGKPRRRWHRK